jgi:glycosyltransferase involved in cell wall biosynthesis
MKLRVLACTEASYLSTGYAVYIREVFKRLHNHPNIELAELSCYSSQDEPRRQLIPWKNYPNLPQPNNDEEKRAYESNPVNCFGAWKFESICLDFKPHVVFIFRDIWMDNFVVNSPFRRLFNLLWMPAVDGYPQNPQWIADYATADAIVSYTDWGCDVLREQSGGQLNILGSTPPAADEAFCPVENKINHKKQYGLEKFKIVGTVMRNQKRKLFPDLFLSFRKFLDNSGRNDVLLYCHTPYPDRNPWNIPELINEYGLSNKVLMTYRCNTALGRNGCGYAFPSLFSDFIKICPNCNKLNATTSDVNNGVDSQFLASVYNLFDVYVQYANMEAFGLPVCEASACGVPLMTTDYAGLSDNGRKLGGVMLKPKGYVKELETGRLQAVPDNDLLIYELEKFFNLSDEEQLKLGKLARTNYLANYGYDKTAAKFLQYFTSLDVSQLDARWSSSPNIKPIEPFDEQKTSQMSNYEYTKWLILNVMGEPKQLGGYFHSKMLKDINYGCSTSGGGGNYFNDMSLFGDNQLTPFTRKNAYDMLANIANIRNIWEQERTKR